MRTFSALAAMVLLAAGCGGTTNAGAGGAGVVPASAPAFVALNVDTDSAQWQLLGRLAGRFPDGSKVTSMFDSALRGQNVDWKRDVKPALGPEIDVAWLDFDNDGQDFAVLMQPDDKQKFEQLLEKDDQAKKLARTEIEGWQVLATSQDVLDRFRSESASAGTLANQKAFAQAAKAYPADSIFRAYVEGGAVMKAAQAVKDASFQKLLPKLGHLDWFATNLRATDEGIRWDTNVRGTPGPAFAGLHTARAFMPTLAREIPQDALAYFAFHGRKGMFDGLQKSPVFADVPQVKRYAGVLRSIGRLLEGENALYLRPSATGRTPEMTFVAEPRAGTDGAATLDGLIHRYHRELQVPAQPKRLRIGGVATRLVSGDRNMYYGNVGKRLVVSNDAHGMTTLGGAKAPLGLSDEYKDARRASGMPDRPQGFVYVNISGGLSYAQRLLKVGLPDGLKRNLSPLRSAVEYAATRPSEIQVTFFLRIT
jgi:hypothetical protein